ncbi:hypothetical protein CLOP_g21287 [Closterium sp. NIES-67]|nr:hypothetical protein CLOP_g21287 [Closterium sp. NIES-67]
MPPRNLASCCRLHHIRGCIFPPRLLMPLALQCILKVRPRIADFLGSAEVRHDSTDQTMAYGSGFSGIYLKRESHAAACWSASQQHLVCWQ